MASSRSRASASAVYELADGYDSDGMDIGASDSPLQNESFGDAENGGVSIVKEPRFTKKTCAILIAVVLAITLASTIYGFVDRKRNKSQSDEIEPTAPTSTAAPVSLTADPIGKPPQYSVKVINVTDHDPNAFLQGFEYSSRRGEFFESTGLEGGRSSMRRVDPASGKVLKSVKLPSSNIFGEGLTLHGTDFVYMLSWKAKRGFVFDQETLELVREWKYTGEGWGLASNRATGVIYMSDGTSELRVLDEFTLAEKSRVTVTLDEKPVDRLNELEFVCGEVWANVWRTTKIYRINPATGVVRSVINVADLPRKEDLVAGKHHDVLNGIAYDFTANRLWITGKLWPKIYEVKVDDDSFASHCDTFRQLLT
jgi:glutaminyl-peptide cyclotransferase